MSNTTEHLPEQNNHESAEHDAYQPTCYQCGRRTNYLFADSRCVQCTRLTPDEILCGREP